VFFCAIIWNNRTLCVYLIIDMKKLINITLLFAFALVFFACEKEMIKPFNKDNHNSNCLDSSEDTDSFTREFALINGDDVTGPGKEEDIDGNDITDPDEEEDFDGITDPDEEEDFDGVIDPDEEGDSDEGDTKL